VRRRVRASVALVAAAAALAGCGFGAGEPTGGVTFTVSRDFGAERLHRVARHEVPSSETVMRLLQRSLAVRTTYGGRFVQAIDNLAGGRRGGQPVDWFFYVNGIEAPQSAAATRIHPGDAIVWDFHPWSATQTIPAIIGSFPEPFAHGTGGRRPPLRLECTADAKAACELAATRLRAAGLSLGRAAFGTGAGRDVARVLLGPWQELRDDRVADQIGRGPRLSGVYARPEAEGRRIAVLDPRGAVAARLGAGTGLIAATRYADQQPTWVVTGTDAAGLRAAAGALTRRALAGRFAAIVRGSAVSSIPRSGSGGDA
jgi:Domain of unknown function (DUF4430)